MTEKLKRTAVGAAVLVLAVLAGGRGVAAQQPVGAARADSAAAGALALSLEEAVQRATQQSEEIQLAKSQVSLASAQVTSARSAALPQINAQLGYRRTFESQFSGGGSFTLPDSLRFEPNPDAPLEERVRYLEDKTPLAGLMGIGQMFSSLPFGQDHSYTAAISGSQVLYAGGKVGAALNIARNYRDAARLNLTEEAAEVELQVRQAYYRVLLAQEMETIAQAALEQAERFLAQERLRFQAGRASELAVLRAEVARENLRPQLVQARNASEVALLNLKRLVDLPLTQPVRLVSRLEAPAPGAAPAQADATQLVVQRAAVRAAEEQVQMRQQATRIARGNFLPSIALQMDYGRTLFPQDMTDFSGNWRTDWTAGVGVQIPIFQGGRRTAELQQANVELTQARLQLAQLREAVQLQYEQARGERERAHAAIAARQQTVSVAQRVYDLTVLRYDQGLATQLEVSDARLALLQARTNLVQALADYYIADAQVARALAGVEPAGAAAR